MQGYKVIIGQDRIHVHLQKHETLIFDWYFPNSTIHLLVTI